MRFLGKRLIGAGVFLFCILLLGGCRRVPEPKTFLLPEAEKKTLSLRNGDNGDYTVQKIYTREYESLLYPLGTAFLQDCGEYQMRVLEVDSGGITENTMDYRYGFYGEEKDVIPDVILENYVFLSLTGDVADQRLAEEYMSPDGRYMLYYRGDQSYTGGRLCLMDLESLKEQVLLDGDQEGYRMDEFQILAAWDRDASLLCYGFFPRNNDIYYAYQGQEKFILHYMDMETGEEMNKLNYSYLSTEGIAWDFGEIRLYVDRNKENILTAFVMEDNSYENSRISLFSQKAAKTDAERTEGIAIPSTMWCEGYASAVLDAEHSHIYGFGGGILEIYNSEGFLISTPEQEWGMTVLRVLPLEEEVFVTTEYGDDSNAQDICLYMQSEDDEWVRQVLYRNAGYVMQIQYDPVWNRILIETGEPGYETESDGMNSDAGDSIRLQSGQRKTIVLEF